MRSALTDVDLAFHEAAYGGYIPEMAKYVVNFMTVTVGLKPVI